MACWEEEYLHGFGFEVYAARVPTYVADRSMTFIEFTTKTMELLESYNEKLSMETMEHKHCIMYIIGVLNGMEGRTDDFEELRDLDWGKSSKVHVMLNPAGAILTVGLLLAHYHVTSATKSEFSQESMCILLLGDSSADVKVLGEIWAEHDDALLALEAMGQPHSEGGRNGVDSSGSDRKHSIPARSSSYNTEPTTLKPARRTSFGM